MKKLFLLLLILTFILGCSKDEPKNTNPYLPNYSFSIVIDMNLPLYSGLNSPINPIAISDGGSGVNLILMKISATDFRVWDASCPNQYPSSCSLMSINGVNAKCSCDEVEYSLFTGVGPSQYPMKSYRFELKGDNAIRVFN